MTGGGFITYRTASFLIPPAEFVFGVDSKNLSSKFKYGKYKAKNKGAFYPFIKLTISPDFPTINPLSKEFGLLVTTTAMSETFVLRSFK